MYHQRKATEKSAADLLRTMERNQSRIMWLVLLILAIEILSVFVGWPHWTTLSIFGMLLVAEVLHNISWQMLRKARKAVFALKMAELERCYRGSRD